MKNGFVTALQYWCGGTGGGIRPCSGVSNWRARHQHSENTRQHRMMFARFICTSRVYTDIRIDFIHKVLASGKTQIMPTAFHQPPPLSVWYDFSLSNIVIWIAPRRHSTANDTHTQPHICFYDNDGYKNRSIRLIPSNGIHSIYEYICLFSYSNAYLFILMIFDEIHIIKNGK